MTAPQFPTPHFQSFTLEDAVAARAALGLGTPQLGYSTIASGYAKLMQGLQYSYWDSGNPSNVPTTVTLLAVTASGTVATAQVIDISGFTVGQTVVIGGVNPAGYNGIVTITGLNKPAKTFTYTIPAGLAAPSAAGPLYVSFTPLAPRIRPTDGSGNANGGLVNNGLGQPSFWQMATFENAMFWDWKITGSPVMRRKLQDQWAFVQNVFTPAQLAGDGFNVTINSSDDAALVAQYFAHVHEVTGDPKALTYLGEMIPATTLRFRDPNQNDANALLNSYGSSPGGVAFANGKYGMLYCAASDAAGIATYGYVSESIEAMTACAAFYFYQQTGYAPYRQFAADTYAWIKARLSTPAPLNGSYKAQHLIETYLVLNPTGMPMNPQPQNAYYGKPIRGVDSTYMLGLMAEAVLGARLYNDSTDPAVRASYLADLIGFAAAIPAPNGYGRTFNNVIVLANTRDPWSDGDMAQPFACEVLTVPGVDADGSCKTAIMNTAANIVSTQIVGTQVTADWGPPEGYPAGAPTSWQAAYAANPGSQAGYQQIQTNGSTLSMVQAGVILEDFSAHRHR